MSSVEEKIRKAMREGKFDNLPGAGKPLNLDDNPHEDPQWRLAHHLLRSNGFTLPWIEARREIEGALDTHRTNLQRAWSWRERALAEGQPEHFVADRWQAALSDFRESITRVNQWIFEHNLSTPSTRFHIRKIDVGREVARIASSAHLSG
jgi:DnaJ family protein C protein 28